MVIRDESISILGLCHHSILELCDLSIRIIFAFKRELRQTCNHFDSLMKNPLTQ